MIVAPENLIEVWAQLARTQGHRDFRSRRLDAMISLNVHAAIRAADEAPCLLIDIEPKPSGSEDFEVDGMRLYRAQSELGLMLVLSLEEPRFIDLFAKICSDTVDFSASAGAGPAESVALFLSRLDAWRGFLRDLRPALGRSELLGIFGELVVLRDLLEFDPGALSTWMSPEDGLHDFSLNGVALEVKASASTSTRLWISKLDQLDDAGLSKLFLIFVRLKEDAEGFTLGDLINDVSSCLSSHVVQRSFENALLRRGLMPDDKTSRESLRLAIGSTTAWQVESGFPRLTGSAVPRPIVEATYALDTRALDEYSRDYSVALNVFTQVNGND